MSASTRTALVAALGVALLALAWALHARGDLLDHAGDYVLLAAGMLAVCAAGTSLLWRRASQRDVVIVLVVALAARAVLAFDAPTLSNDVYRFAWDGRVQAAGTNPYRYAPADEALRALRDGEVFPRLNRPRTRTLYPPANEVFYVAAHEAGGYSVRSVKLALLAIEAVVVALLLVLLRRARLSPGRVVLYAWQPLAIVEIAARGHSEPLLIVLTLAALLAWDARAQAGSGARADRRAGGVGRGGSAARGAPRRRLAKAATRICPFRVARASSARRAGEPDEFRTGSRRFQ